MTTKSLVKLAVLPGPRACSLRLALQSSKAFPPRNRRRCTVAWVLMLSNLPPNPSIARPLQVPLYPSIQVGDRRSSAKTITEQQRPQALPAPSLPRSLRSLRGRKAQHGMRRTMSGKSWGSLGKGAEKAAMNTRCVGRALGCLRARWETRRDWCGNLKRENKYSENATRADWCGQSKAVNCYNKHSFL